MTHYLPKTCRCCGKAFTPDYPNERYCRKCKAKMSRVSLDSLMERKLALQSEIHILEDQQIGFCCVRCVKYGYGCGGFVCTKMDNIAESAT